MRKISSQTRFKFVPRRYTVRSEVLQFGLVLKIRFQLLLACFTPGTRTTVPTKQAIDSFSDLLFGPLTLIIYSTAILLIVSPLGSRRFPPQQRSPQRPARPLPAFVVPTLLFTLAPQ